jgi:hypothetical protein
MKINITLPFGDWEKNNLTAAHVGRKKGNYW